MDGSNLWDAIKKQTSGDPADHAMRQPWEDAAAASRRMKEFIAHEAMLAQADPYHAMYHYGRMMHPITDSTSPLHQNFPPWPNTEAGKHGDHGPEDESHVTPQVISDVINAMKRYAPDTNICGCKLP